MDEPSSQGRHSLAFAARLVGLVLLGLAVIALIQVSLALAIGFIATSLPFGGLTAWGPTDSTALIPAFLYVFVITAISTAAPLALTQRWSGLRRVIWWLLLLGTTNVVVSAVLVALTGDKGYFSGSYSVAFYDFKAGPAALLATSSALSALSATLVLLLFRRVAGRLRGTAEECLSEGSCRTSAST